MPIVILIPFLVCIVVLFRDSVQMAFMNVFLPIFIVFPTYYYWKVAMLPPIDFSEAVLVPLGIAILLKELPRWRFSILDLFVALFIFTTAYAQLLQGEDTAAKFQLFANAALVLVPYAAGKLLIEKDRGRNAMLKRMVFCLFFASIIAAYEYRMGANPFMLLGGHIFPDEQFAWKTQFRWGFGRVSGPYGQSELAGMMLFFGLALSLYLTYVKAWEPKFRYFEWLPGKKSTIITGVIGLTLLMAQARGPWIGALVALPVAFIGRARRVLLTSVVVGTLCLVGGSFSYVALNSYANAPVTSQEQENAQYRAHLLDNYLPVARAGGPWGWGQHFPRVAGQDSIDNEYLFLALTQGWVGLASFCLLALGAIVHLVRAAIYNTTKNDRYFAFTLLGILLGLLITIFTVFLGNQPYVLFFLLIGWSQAVRTQEQKATVYAFDHVYS